VAGKLNSQSYIPPGTQSIVKSIMTRSVSSQR